MKYVWLQSSINSNKFKTISLVLLFPIFLFIITIGVFAIEASSRSIGVDTKLFWDYVFKQSSTVMLIVIPIILVWFIISFSFHRKIIFKFAWAKPITRKEFPEIYNIVENLCISKWLPTPNIWIIEDDSMNAFATGWKPKKSRIVFSKWIINRLDKDKIEAVAWHELTHIINKDTLLMVCIVVFIWIIGTAGEILVRSAWSVWKKDSDSSKWAIALLLIGFWLMILWYLIFPIIRLSISRKREFLADAGSVELTKNKQAMIWALQKISTDSRIESIKKQTVAAMCIETPFSKDKNHKIKRFHNLLRSHPSIEKRIKALNNY